MSGGQSNLTRRWPMAAAWSAATEVAAVAFGISPDLLRAPSRGRGPKPPVAAREPKKMAVHLAVMLADCEYAELGRLIGLHKDTVASHCAGQRARCDEDIEAEATSDLLLAAAMMRLELLAGSGSPRRRHDPATRAQCRAFRLDALELMMNQALRTLRDATSDEPQKPSDPRRISSDEHRKVIAAPANRRVAA